MLKHLRMITRNVIQILRKYRYKKNVDFGGDTYIGRRVAFHGKAVIGLGTYIGEYSIIAPDTIIGKYCMLSSEVSIIGKDHYINKLGVPAIYSGRPPSKPTIIGSDVFIGHRSIIFSGITIEDGAVIAAGSIVTKNVGACEIYINKPQPAKLFRFTETEAKEHMAKLKIYQRKKNEIK